MLGIATVATMATSPGQTFLVSQFYTSFQTEMRLDSTVGLAAAYMYGTLGAGLLMPLVGALSDRFGTRVMMGIAAAGLAFSCVLIGYAQNLLQLGFAFFCLRVFGQGALSLVSSHTIAMWFEKRLGIAESIRHTGMSIANVVLPPLAIAAIALFGWKAAYGLLGLAVYLAVIPPVLLLFRNKPEDIGQRVDHARAPAPVDRTIDDLEPDSITDLSRDPHTPPTPELLEPYFTPRQAIRTGAYWIVTGALVANASIFTAVALEHQVIVREAGHDPKVAASLLPLAGLVAMLAVPISGWLVDRYAERKLLACTTVLLGMSCVCVAFAEALPVLYGSMVLMGMTQSLIFVLASPIFARYFGRRHHGAIRGTLTRSMIVGTAVGPAGLSFFAEQVGGYRVPMLVCAAITIPLTIASLSMRRPDEPDHDTTAI
jgi:MFS transporter, OFA family, oxalate/formate antiporter